MMILVVNEGSQCQSREGSQHPNPNPSSPEG